MKDKRYTSGTSLQKTNKERAIEGLESHLGAEFPDEFFIALKKLTTDDIVTLRDYVRCRNAMGLES